MLLINLLRILPILLETLRIIGQESSADNPSECETRTQVELNPQNQLSGNFPFPQDVFPRTQGLRKELYCAELQVSWPGVG